jgi:hypothetical protein
MDRQVLFAEVLRNGKLQRIAEIHRNGQRPLARRQRRSEREQVGDARDDDRDRVNIHSGDMQASLDSARGRVHAAVLRFGQKQSQGMKQKCA